MPQNLVEKIAERYAIGLEPGIEVHTGDFLSIRPAHVLTHDNTGAVIPKFKSIGARRVTDPRQAVIALDHNVQDESEGNLEKYVRIEAFAREMGIDFYPAGRGIGHQIMCEEGYAWPGTLAVASDSHANMYGGLGCLGTPVVRTDAAAIWATGRTWWQVPRVARVELFGRLRPGVTGKDLILTLCSVFNQDEVLNHAVEFSGEGLASLQIEQRLSIANMTTEWGALAGLFPIDGVCINWLRDRAAELRRQAPRGVASDDDRRDGHPRINEERIAALEQEGLEADAEAPYAVGLRLDLDSVSPWVAGPNSIKEGRPVAGLKQDRLRIDKAYLVSCVNARASDIAQAAEILRGHRVAAGVELYVAAASSRVQQECEARGDWQVLMEAGAIALPSGCGPCIGLGRGLLRAGEVGVSATNRNFKGRMGSPEALCYLASPAVVAASAASGHIDLPGEVEFREPAAEIRSHSGKSPGGTATRILGGFPEELSGELVFCHQDNLNTDGIYPGAYTYRDDMGPREEAAVVMENYDPRFREIARKGDILVGGFNFGTGSSREQAATALKHFGIRLVLAGSFSETYKRNALNNGFLAIEAPELVRDLLERCGRTTLTFRTELLARIDFRKSVLETMERKYTLGPVGTAAQELIIQDGLSNWVRSRINR